MNKPTLCALVVGILAGQLHAAELPDLGDSSLANLPPNAEKQIAQSAARELRQSGEVIDDVEISDYLNSLGNRLVSASDDARQGFTFYPLLSSSINAFAIPGGVVGVNSGLILTAQHESELAAVLSHEIAHVTQHHYARMVESQKGAGWMSLAAIALAILASRGSGDATQAALAGATGLQYQRQIDFTREFEREADRVGIATLERAGFDTKAMPAFFERLQRFYRNVDNGAFAFLRTHPVTGERIADSAARAAQTLGKTHVDSIEFLLMRERVRAIQLGGRSAVDYYKVTIEQKRYVSAVAQQYGLAVAANMVGDYELAKRSLMSAKKVFNRPSPSLDALEGAIELSDGKATQALEIFRSARVAAPYYRALLYGELDALIRLRRDAEAVALVEEMLGRRPGDSGLYKRQAFAYTQMNRLIDAKRAQAEYFVSVGDPIAAIEQLQMAVKVGGGDYYQMSAIEARLKELRQIIRATESDERKRRNVP
ncbi:M48 family metalloprotease [Parachitinimonas caeni]|uniref:M48 family metalloprotease n=1 Tax=Parachitinimonas caeni TaxID=3031301 RepID=A0ABT7DXM2_9NEIS|nr:M48 family metalloprotease [Parachitinimonas caeni]MDK2124781.1 M48 family metalloprotease [Parachitinimonas caeni]